eukprot:Hpha_TRINITY_DN8235_c1_g1::TRINITY_DN8235_c1_g1_i1::g.111865::m.111865
MHGAGPWRAALCGAVFLQLSQWLPRAVAQEERWAAGPCPTRTTCPSCDAVCEGLDGWVCDTDTWPQGAEVFNGEPFASVCQNAGSTQSDNAYNPRMALDGV